MCSIAVMILEEAHVQVILLIVIVLDVGLISVVQLSVVNLLLVGGILLV